MPLNNSAPTPIDVHIRRVVENIVVFDQVAQSISTSAAAPTFGTPIDVSDYSEMLIIVAGNALVGAAAGMNIVIQTLETYVGNSSTSWVNLPTFGTNGVQAITATATGQTAFAAASCTNFGDIIRVGLYTTSNYTSGTLDITLKLKR
jgi:hypothetical protein